jgi:large subunit ribosomal protein L22
MEAIAKTKYLKGSPRKARLVIDLIRGRNVSHALSILRFTEKRAADPIAKTLRSAIANATYQAEQQNIAIDPDDLWVKSCFVDMGAYREQRHYCHITIHVTSDEQPKTEKEMRAETAKAKKASEAGTANKSPAKKAAAPKKTKKADKPLAEEVETPTAEAADSPVAETAAPAETAAQVEAQGNADAADAKNIETQTTAALNEEKPADEKMQDTNEELERQ